jgi:hypothetical protein
MEAFSKFAIPGLLSVLTLVFGFWLSHAGKPYNGILFNVHKLIALGAVVLAVFQLTKIPNLLTPVSLVAVGLVLAALSVIALFVSGALMSAGKLDYALMLTIHRIAPLALAVGFGLVMIFLKSAL